MEYVKKQSFWLWLMLLIIKIASQCFLFGCGPNSLLHTPGIDSNLQVGEISFWSSYLVSTRTRNTFDLDSGLDRGSRYLRRLSLRIFESMLICMEFSSWTSNIGKLASASRMRFGARFRLPGPGAGCCRFRSGREVTSTACQRLRCFVLPTQTFGAKSPKWRLSSRAAI